MYFVANWNQQYRFPTPYAKTDIETKNKKSGGETLQDNGYRQSVG